MPLIFIRHAVDARVPPHITIHSNTFLSKSLVTTMLYINWFAWSFRSLAYGFLLLNRNVMEKSFSKGMKYLFNSDTFSNITSSGCGYLHRNEWKYIWLTLTDDLHMYSSLKYMTSLIYNHGTWMVLNQTVMGSSIFIQASLKSFSIIVSLGLLCTVELLYINIRSIFTKLCRLRSEIILGGRFLWHLLHFLNCSHILRILTDIYDCVTGPFQ